jgi:hypothetical protein
MISICLSHACCNRSTGSGPPFDCYCHRAIAWVCPRTELRSSWKPRHRSSPLQIRGRRRGEGAIYWSGLAEGGLPLLLLSFLLSFLAAPHPAWEAMGSGLSRLFQAGLNCPVPEIWERRKVPLSCTEWGESAYLGITFPVPKRLLCSKKKKN